MTIEEHKKIGKTLKDLDSMMSKLINLSNLTSRSYDKCWRIINRYSIMKSNMERTMYEDHKNNPKLSTDIYYGKSKSKKLVLEQRKGIKKQITQHKEFAKILNNFDLTIKKIIEKENIEPNKLFKIVKGTDRIRHKLHHNMQFTKGIKIEEADKNYFKGD